MYMPTIEGTSLTFWLRKQSFGICLLPGVSATVRFVREYTNSLNIVLEKCSQLNKTGGKQEVRNATCLTPDLASCKSTTARYCARRHILKTC